ncbi:MAG: MBL fold metallo-hydrolase [Salibacteraceae bacterium]
MSAIKYTVLGSGTSMGVPVIGCKCDVCRSSDVKDKRLRTSLLIETDSTTVVIDCGPDFRQQMLSRDIDRLDGVVFTHEHKDHTAGVDEVRAFNFILNKEVVFWATDRVEAALRHDYHYAFGDLKYPGTPSIRFSRVGDAPFEIGNMEFVPIHVLHHKLPVTAYRIGKLTYITDANFIPDEEWSKITGTEVLIINALRRSSHLSHFTLDQAIEIARKLGVKTTYFIHISHQMGRHAEIESTLPEGMHLAYDGLVIEL